MIYKEICDENEKKKITKDVLTDLPEWFGIPESVTEYIEESSKMVYYACFDNEDPVGLLAINTTSECTAEIYVMGIKKKYHRRGIGKQLFEKCMKWCKDNGYEFLQVKTLDSANPDKYYAETRKYYRAMGFKPFETFKTLWDPSNPCLVMIMNVE